MYSAREWTMAIIIGLTVKIHWKYVDKWHKYAIIIRMLFLSYSMFTIIIHYKCLHRGRLNGSFTRPRNRWFLVCFPRHETNFADKQWTFKICFFIPSPVIKVSRLGNSSNVLLLLQDIIYTLMAFNIQKHIQHSFTKLVSFVQSHSDALDHSMVSDIIICSKNLTHPGLPIT